jgi:hypothetical protein
VGVDNLLFVGGVDVGNPLRDLQFVVAGRRVNRDGETLLRTSGRLEVAAP